VTTALRPSVSTLRSTVGATAPCSRISQRWRPTRRRCTRSGAHAGPCDLGIDFSDDTDAHVAAVWPFFGQFVAHDITADRSPVTHRADADLIRNFRVPRANLEGL
jgi:hypothetical protein